MAEEIFNRQKSHVCETHILSTLCLLLAIILPSLLTLPASPKFPFLIPQHSSQQIAQSIKTAEMIKEEPSDETLPLGMPPDDDEIIATVGNIFGFDF